MERLKELLRRQYTKTEAIAIMFSVMAIGTIFDLFSGRSSILFLIVSIFLVAIGFRQYRKNNTLSSYILMGIGATFLILSFITSFAFTLLLALVIVYYSYQLFRSSKKKTSIKVNIKEDGFTIPKPFISIEPYFKNVLIGDARRIESTYELEDINIQCGFGDIHIDLTNQFIPEGEVVILIRGGVGHIHLTLPADIGLSMQTSLWLGKVSLLKEEEKTTFNATQKYQTTDYKEATRKFKIIISLLAGDIEVRQR